MGHKTHPLGFRLGIIKDWKAHWYSQGAAGYSAQVKEDLQIRDIVKDEYTVVPKMELSTSILLAPVY